jgi:hypothetical protein
MTASIWGGIAVGPDGVVNSVAELRALVTTVTFVETTGYYTKGDGGAGFYYYDSADTVSADNGGTIIVAADNKRWKLLFTNVLNVKQFGAKGDGSTDDYAAVQATITAALKSDGPGRIYFPESALPYKIGTSLECNDQTAAGNYRRSVEIFGAGQHRTTVLNRAAIACFKHTLTQSQGDNNYFARGFQIHDLNILGDGTTPANSSGVWVQGAYYPIFQNLYISTMTLHGIFAPADVRWANPDSYSCADILVQDCTILSCGGWGVNNQSFASALKIRSPYIVSNVGGGVYLEGSVHEITGGAVAGNGAAADANSFGIHIARSANGTPQNCIVQQCEIDNNYNNYGTD